MLEFYFHPFYTTNNLIYIIIYLFLNLYLFFCCILKNKGSWQPMGHVDFYPNGGRVQNGCSNLFVGAVTDFIWC